MPAVIGHVLSVDHPVPSVYRQLLSVGRPLLSVTRQLPPLTVQVLLVDCRQDKFRPVLHGFLLSYKAGRFLCVWGGGVVCGPRGSGWSAFTRSSADLGCPPERVVHWIRLGSSIAGYMCPQYLRDQRYSEKSEVHSFGVVLCELISGLLAQQLDIKDLLKEDELEADARPGPWPDALVQGLLRLAKNCTRAVPDKRPQMLTVMRCVQCVPSAFSCASVVRPFCSITPLTHFRGAQEMGTKGGVSRTTTKRWTLTPSQTLRMCSVRFSWGGGGRVTFFTGGVCVVSRVFFFVNASRKEIVQCGLSSHF